MPKLRRLEVESAKLIQKHFRKYLANLEYGPNSNKSCMVRSRACQTDTDSGFHKMAADFYSKIGSKQDLMSTLQKSMFESYALFYIATQI